MLFVSNQSSDTMNRIVNMLARHAQNPFIVKEVMVIVSQYCSLSRKDEGQKDELHWQIS